jgi:hypothetical protein
VGTEDRNLTDQSLLKARVWEDNRSRKRDQFSKEVETMRHTTLFPVTFRDLIIGLIALVLAMAIWAALITPTAV